MKEFYFPHDYNPTNDPKIVCLLGNYGGLGYGIYWRVIELLHQEENNKLPLKTYIYQAIAKQMLTTAKEVESILEDCFSFELLVKDEEFFWSNRVIKNIGQKQDKSNKNRENAKKMWENRRKLEASVSVRKESLTNKIKENKIKEYNIKEYNIIGGAPSQVANKFFSDVEHQENIAKQIAIKYNIELQTVKEEINKFISYWTEPNKSGSKNKWQMQPTFEVSRRLATWFGNVGKFRGNNFKNIITEVIL